MMRSVIRRVQKVFATERRRLSGNRIAKPKPVISRAEIAAEDQEKDLEALDAEAMKRESIEPSKDDNAFKLIERTWKRRHASHRRQPPDTLEMYLEQYPFMSSWRMVYTSVSMHACRSLHVLRMNLLILTRSFSVEFFVDAL